MTAGMDTLSIRWRQILIFCFLATVKFFGDMVYSLQGPLFPREAQSKGATATEFGVVMGSYELAVLFFSPASAFVAARIIPIMFTISIFTIGLSTILFAHLTLISSKPTFVGLGCLLRIIEAAGSTGIFVSVNYFITAEFTSGRSLALGLLEGLTNVAFAFGPFLATVLYQLGGFSLPFEIVGGGLILAGILAHVSMRMLGLTSRSTCTPDPMRLPFWNLFRLPPVVVTLMVVLVGALNAGFLFSMLEIHLRQFSLTSVEVGLVFLLYGVMCALGSPLFCYLADKTEIPEFLSLGGAICCSVTFILLGPAPFLSIQPTLPLSIGSVMMLGIGISMTISTGFVIALNETMASGASDDAGEVSIQVSGLWNATLAIGLFLSPIIAGSLYDSFGLRFASMFTLSVDFLLVAFLGIFIFWKVKYYQRSRQGTDEISQLIR